MSRIDFINTVAQFQMAYSGLVNMDDEQQEVLDGLISDYKGSADPDALPHAVGVCAQMCAMLAGIVKENEG